jgi:hypothetical protein
VNLDSSAEIEKIVFEIIAASKLTGILVIGAGISGSSGKLSRDMPAIRVRERPQTNVAQ